MADQDFDLSSVTPIHGPTGQDFDLSNVTPTGGAPRSALGEVITAAKRGLYEGAAGAGSVIQGAGEAAGVEPGVISHVGKAIEDWGKGAAQGQDLAPQPESHGPVTNFLAGAAEAPGSALPLLAAAAGGSAAGTAILPGVGTVVGGALGGGSEAALQTYHEKYQQAKAAGMKDADARDVARNNALIQGGLMAGVSAIPFAGGVVSKVLGTGTKDAAETAADVVAKKFWPEAGKAAAETAAVNVGLGAAGAAGENLADQGTALDQGKTPGQAAIDSLAPNVQGAAGFIPLALWGAHGTVKQAQAIRTALTDPSVPAEDRIKAASQVAQAVGGKDKDAAHVFADNALEAIKQGKTIGVDPSWFEGPHESLQPEPKGDVTTEDQAGTLDNEGGGQGPQAMPPYPDQKALPEPGRTTTVAGDDTGMGPIITANNEAETQRIANETYAARDAEEQRLQALASNGPISSAAADAIRSGAAGEALDRRTQEAQQPAALPEPPDAKTQRENDELNQTAGIMGSVPLERAQHAAQVGEMSGYDLSVVPHPGGGFTVVPSAKLSDTQREQFANIQRAGELPSPTAKRPNEFISDAQGNVRPKTVDDNLTGLHQAAGDFERVMGTAARKQFPLDLEAAQAKAANLTATTGTEYEAVPHPLARNKFAVQEKAASTEREQPEKVNAQSTSSTASETGPGAATGLAKVAAESKTNGTTDEEPYRVHDAEGHRVESFPTMRAAEEHIHSLGDEGAGYEVRGPEDRKQNLDRSLSPNEVVEHSINHDERAADHTKDPALARLIHEPTFLSQNAVNNIRAKGLTTKEAQTLAAVVKELRRNGHPDARLADVDHVFTQDTGAEGTYYWQAKAIALDRSMLARAADDPAWFQKLAGVFSHELAHRSDEGEDNFHSAEHPAFAIGARDKATGLRAATGGLAKEAYKAATQHPALREYLRYPFRMLHDEVGKGRTERQHMEMLSSEVYAQLNSLFYTNRKLLRDTMPKAYSFFKDIHDRTNQSVREGHRAESPVREAFRSLGADGRAVEPELGRDQRQDRISLADRDSRAGLGQAADLRERSDEDGSRVQRGSAESAQGPDRPALEGLPKSSPGPFAPAREAAASYMKEAGLPYQPPTKFARVDPAFGKKVADAYDKMDHAPQSPEVKRAYKAMIDETVAQWHAMMKTGLKVSFTDAEHPYPYKLPHDVFKDVRDNNHMWVYSTDEGFGGPEATKTFDASDNPLLAPTDIKVGDKTLLANDVFRAVHDFFGHIEEGVGFRHDGEENAWRIHSAMFSPEARAAMTSETRGQNNWVNWGPHGEKNRTASQETTEYAAQKSGLLPKQFHEDTYEPRKPEAMERRDTEPKAGDATVNIGLDTNDGKGITRKEALDALKRAGVKIKVDEIRKSKTEQTLVATLDRALTPEEAHKVAVELKQEAIAQKVGDAGELYGPGAEAWKPFNKKFFLGHTKEGENALISRKADETITSAAGTALTPAERAVLKNGVPRVALKRAQRFAAIFDLLPKAADYIHAALAGRAARRWYERSRIAGEAMYGRDYPRFAALMAALSPQTDVPTNFYNAAQVWAEWNRKGRPTDAKAIVKILNDNMITPDGKKAGAEIMDAYKFNAIRALRHETGDVQLSGPKVESFRQNLIGNLTEVTNDRHNAAFSGITEDLLAGVPVKPPETDLSKKFGIKGEGYIATSVRYREAAKALTKAMGEPWSPAEVQETSWSFWRTLYNMATAEGETRSALQLIRDGALTHELIAETPTLGQYFDTKRFHDLTRGEAQASDGDAVAASRISAAERGVTREAGPVIETPAIRRIAQRLDDLIADRKFAAEAKAGDKRFDDANKELNRAGAENVPELEALGDAAEAEPREIRKPMAMEHRSEDEPLWYSPLRKGIDEKAPFSKAGEIDARMLSNWLDSRAKDGTVKGAEIEASGIKDWLALAADAPDAKFRKVSREDVQSFLDQNGARVEEKMLGGADSKAARKYEVYNEGTGAVVGAFDTEAGAEAEVARRGGRPFAVDTDDKSTYNESSTKFHSWQLPGGKNYRELLLTLPSVHTEHRTAEQGGGWMARDRNSSAYGDTEAQAKARLDTPQFRSSHFGEPNILAHVRFNERTDADGKKVLFLEELQSDWAQKGRKQGFAGDTTVLTQRKAAIEKEMADLAKDRDPKTNVMRDERLWHALASEKEGIDREISRSSGVPAAPFVGKTEAWTALALKRMIRYAADNGFDRIAWTNGDQQAERYDLSKRVDTVTAKKLDNGNVWLDVTAKNGLKSIFEGEVPVEKVEDYVGKDLAKRIAEETQFQAGRKNSVKVYRGLDLKVGGEGMKAFYDKIVPNVANDVLKKLGGDRVGEVKLDTADKNPQKMTIEQTNTFGSRPRWIVTDGDGGWIGPHFSSHGQAQGWIDTYGAKHPETELTTQPGFDVPKEGGRKPQAMFAHVGDAEARFDDKGNVEEPKPTKQAEPISAKNMPPWMRDLSPETQETLRKAGVFVTKAPLKQRWRELKDQMGLKIIQGTVDQFRPVLEKIGAYPYKLLRMASSSDSALAASLDKGQLELNSAGALQIKKGTQSLLDVLKPLQGETDRFFAWVAGNRAERLAAEDREHLFGDADIATLKGLNSGNLATGESRTMTYAKVLRDYNAFSKSILDIAEKAGIIDGEKRALWEHQFYVPFFREQEEGGQAVTAGNLSGMVNQYAFKKLKGGEGVLHDLLANTVQNWGHLLSASMKNAAAVRTLGEAEKLGIAHVVKEHEAPKGAVFVLKDGKKVHYVVDDPLVLDAVSSLEQTPFKGPVMKALSQMKHALTVGTTWSPVFRLRHTLREQITALAANPTTYNFVKNWLDGFKYSDKNNPAYGNMEAGGAFMRMGQQLDYDRAAYLKRLVAQGVDQSTILDTPGKVSAMFGHAFDWWKETGERSDSITRANIYRQQYEAMIKAGKSPDEAHFEAAYAARDVMDFGLHGTWPAVRMLTQVVPFMNARMQGIYKLGRGAAEDPKRFAGVIGGITLATIALSLYNRDDKDIQGAEEFDRDNNWLFKVGKTMYRIPKPFEVGALATVVDRALETAMSGFSPSERERFANRLIPIVGSQLNLNPVPQGVFPMLELWANKDVFTGRAIENARDENLSPTERFSGNTTMLARGLSNANAAALSFLPRATADKGTLSPEQIDFLVNAYLGWVGSHAVATSDLLARPIVGAPAKATKKIDDYFLVGDFAKELPQNQSRFVEQFYDHLKQVQQSFGDMQSQLKLGQPEKARETFQERKADIVLHPMYQAAQHELGLLGARQRFIQMSENMTPDQKREALDQLAQQRKHITEMVENNRDRIQNQ